MRFFLLFCMLSTAMFAGDTLAFFKQSPDNRLLCHIGQYSFKMISQKNAVIEEIQGHTFFKLKDENFYFLNTACQSVKNNDEPILF